MSVTFTGESLPGAQVAVPVDDYRSPTLSAAGYTVEIAGETPDGWTSLSANVVGGVRYPLLAAIGAVVGAEDARAQQILGALRIQTCIGEQIATWAQDFFGGFLPKYNTESYGLYRARVLLALQGAATIPAIQSIVTGFYEAVAHLDPQFLGAKSILAYDTGGGGYDTGVGAYDRAPLDEIVAPAVLVWDLKTRPDLAADFGVVAGQFVVMIGTPPPPSQTLSYDRVGAYDRAGAFDRPTSVPNLSTDAPDPRLGDLVNLKKADGVQPLYLVYP